MKPNLKIAAFVMLAVIAITACDVYVKVTTQVGGGIAGVPVKLFKADGSYTGKQSTTGGSGKAFFSASSGTYYFEAYYQTRVFRSANFKLGAFQDPGTVKINTERIDFRLATDPALGALAVETHRGDGTSIGVSGQTDGTGAVILPIAKGDVKFHARYQGLDSWSQVYNIPAQSQGVLAVQHECLANADCNDGDPCTDDLCDGPNGCSTTPNDCEDDNVCTDCSCDPVAGCICQPVAQPTACDDQNICTIGDHCSEDQCVGVPMPCDDNLDCTADSCNSAGECVHELMAGACLIDGVCYSTGPHPANPCLVCSPQAPAVWTPLNGNSCDADGSGCTLDTCLEGICIVGPAPDCSSQTDQCNTGVCSSTGPESYVCAKDPAPHNDQTCNQDANGCTLDTCQDGVCMVGPTPDCSSQTDQCNTGVCASTGNESYVCAKDPAPHNNQSCNQDASGCTLDTCQEGVCVVGAAPDCSSESNQCNTGVCSSTGPESYACVKDPAPHNDQSCDQDANGCTLDTCQEGVCTVGLTPDCSSQTDRCNTGVCSSTGPDGYVCTKDPAPHNDQSCNQDANGCTLDTCQEGVCVVGLAPDCSSETDPCNTGVCSSTGPESYACIKDPAPHNSQPCNRDANGCTLDICQGGVCTAGSTPDCSSQTDQCNTGACSSTGPTSYTCVKDPAPHNNQSCNLDSNGCTLDTCQAGVCTAGPMADCSGQNDPCNTGVCSSIGPESYACIKNPAPHNGQRCNLDWNGCTLDICQGGVCMAGPAPDCSSLNDPCNTGVCRSTSANNYVCEADWAPHQGQPCNADDTECTVADVCSGGDCLAGAPKDCSALDDDCNVGVCVPASGNCEQEPRADETPCADDGIACTLDECLAGQCSHEAIADGYCLIDGLCYMQGDENPNLPCLYCDPSNTPAEWSDKPTGTPCEDEIFCNGDDACGGGTCSVHTGDPCQGFEACNNSCNETARNCLSDPGASCPDDGNVCTSDVCDGQGVCGVPVAGNPPCEDGIDCTVGDSCQNGSCTAGQPQAERCDDHNFCTQDQCLADSGCAHAPVATPLPCLEDGLDCTLDLCNTATGECDHSVKDGYCKIDGACWTNGAADPDDACRKCDVQVSRTEWTPSPNSSCEDGVVCTRNDTCQDGQCIAGAPDDLFCDDSNPDTYDRCVSGLGCEHYSIVIDAPSAGAVLHTGTVAVAGHISGLNNVPKVTVAEEDANYLSGNVFEHSLTYETGGIKIITVKAFWNESSGFTKSFTIELDLDAPAISFTQPAAWGPFQGSGSVSETIQRNPVSFAGNVEDDNLASLRMQRGEVWTSLPVYGGIFVFTLDLLADPRSFTLEAKDIHGNATTVEVSLTLTGAPPLVEILEPSEGQSLDVSPVAVSIRVTPPNPVAVEVIVNNRSPLAASPSGDDWTATVDLDSGTNVIRAEATNDQQATSHDTVTVIYTDLTEADLEVLAVNPEAGSGDVSVNRPILVAFNKPLDPASLTTAEVGDTVVITMEDETCEGYLNLTPDGRSVYFAALDALPYATMVNVAILGGDNGVRSADGGAMPEDYRFSFSTEPHPTTLGGSVLSIMNTPMAGVEVSVQDADLKTITDAHGRYLISGVSKGRQRLEFVARESSMDYPVRLLDADVIEHQNNIIKFPLIMAPADEAATAYFDGAAQDAQQLDFSPGQEGLVLTFGSGSLVFADGNTSGWMSLSPIPSEFIPYPHESGMPPTMAYQVTPSGAQTRESFCAVFPNSLHLTPGRMVLIQAFSKDDMRLKVRGYGYVDPDGAFIRSVDDLQPTHLDYLAYTYLPAQFQQALEWYFEQNAQGGQPDGCVPGGTDGDDGQSGSAFELNWEKILAVMVLWLESEAAASTGGLNGIWDFGSADDNFESITRYPDLFSSSYCTPARMDYPASCVNAWFSWFVQEYFLPRPLFVRVQSGFESYDVPDENMAGACERYFETLPLERARCLADVVTASTPCDCDGCRGDGPDNCDNIQDWLSCKNKNCGIGIGDGGEQCYFCSSSAGTKLRWMEKPVEQAYAFSIHEDFGCWTNERGFCVTKAYPLPDPATGGFTVMLSMAMTGSASQIHKDPDNFPNPMLPDWAQEGYGGSKIWMIVPVITYARGYYNAQQHIDVYENDPDDPSDDTWSYPFEGIATVNTHVISGLLSFRKRDGLDRLSGQCSPILATDRDGADLGYGSPNSTWDKCGSYLSEISATDIEKTEIYVYNLSAEREQGSDKIVPMVVTQATAIEQNLLDNLDAENADVFRNPVGMYQIHLRTTLDTSRAIADLPEGTLGRQLGMLSEYLHRVEANGEHRTHFVRPGDVLLIVAVNRVTGYTGARQVIVGGQTNDISQNHQAAARFSTVANIGLHPSEVQIMAKRRFKAAGWGYAADELVKCTSDSLESNCSETLVRHEGLFDTDDEIDILSNWRIPFSSEKGKRQCFRDGRLYDVTSLPLSLDISPQNAWFVARPDTIPTPETIELRPSDEAEIFFGKDSTALKKGWYFLQGVGGRYYPIGSSGSDEGVPAPDPSDTRYDSAFEPRVLLSSISCAERPTQGELEQTDGDVAPPSSEDISDCSDPIPAASVKEVWVKPDPSDTSARHYCERLRCSLVNQQAKEICERQVGLEEPDCWVCYNRHLAWRSVDFKVEELNVGEQGGPPDEDEQDVPGRIEVYPDEDGEPPAFSDIDWLEMMFSVTGPTEGEYDSADFQGDASANALFGDGSELAQVVITIRDATNVYLKDVNCGFDAGNGALACDLSQTVSGPEGGETDVKLKCEHDQQTNQDGVCRLTIDDLMDLIPDSYDDYLDLRVALVADPENPIWRIRLVSPINVVGYWTQRSSETERQIKLITPELEALVGTAVPVFAPGENFLTDASSAVLVKLEFRNGPVDSFLKHLPESVAHETENLKAMLLVENFGHGGRINLHDVAGGISEYAYCDDLAEGTISGGAAGCMPEEASTVIGRGFADAYGVTMTLTAEPSEEPEDPERLVINEDNFTENLDDPDAPDYLKQEAYYFIHGTSGGTIWKDTDILFAVGYYTELPYDPNCHNDVVKVHLSELPDEEKFFCPLVRDRLNVSPVHDVDLGHCDFAHQCYAGINLNNLNLVLGGYTDFAYDGPFPFALTRTYNSRDFSQGAFGLGWTSSVARQLYLEDYRIGNATQMRMVWVRPDGKQIRFTLNPDMALLNEDNDTPLEEGHYLRWLGRDYVPSVMTPVQLKTIKNVPGLEDVDEGRAFVIYDPTIGYAEVYEGDRPPYRLRRIVYAFNNSYHADIAYQAGPKPDAAMGCPTAQAPDYACPDGVNECPASEACLAEYLGGEWNHGVEQVAIVSIDGLEDALVFEYNTKGLVETITLGDGPEVAFFSYKDYCPDGDEDPALCRQRLEWVRSGEVYQCFDYGTTGAGITAVKTTDNAFCTNPIEQEDISYSTTSGLVERVQEFGGAVEVRDSNAGGGGGSEWQGEDLLSFFVKKSKIFTRTVRVETGFGPDTYFTYTFDQQNGQPKITNNFNPMVGPQESFTEPYVYKAWNADPNDNCRPSEGTELTEEEIEKYRACGTASKGKTATLFNGLRSAANYLSSGDWREKLFPDNLSCNKENTGAPAATVPAVRMVFPSLDEQKKSYVAPALGPDAEPLDFMQTVAGVGGDVTISRESGTTDTTSAITSQDYPGRLESETWSGGGFQLNTTMQGSYHGELFEGTIRAPGPDAHVNADSVTHLPTQFATVYSTGASRSVALDRSPLEPMAQALHLVSQEEDDQTGSQTSYEYHSSGAVASVRDCPFGQSFCTQSTYDIYGRLIHSSDGIVNYDYSRPNLIRGVDAEYIADATNYDWLDRTTTVSGVHGQVVDDGPTDGGSYSYHYDYTQSGMLREVSRSGQTVYSAYYSKDYNTAGLDDRGQVLHSENSNGIQTFYEYYTSGFLTGKVSRVTTGDGSGEVEYFYDNRGRLKSVRSGDHTVDYVYDALGRLVSMHPQSDLAPTTYTYYSPSDDIPPERLFSVTEGEYSALFDDYSGPEEQIQHITYSNDDPFSAGFEVVIWGSAENDPNYHAPTQTKFESWRGADHLTITTAIDRTYDSLGLVALSGASVTEGMIWEDDAFPIPDLTANGWLLSSATSGGKGYVGGRPTTWTPARFADEPNFDDPLDNPGFNWLGSDNLLVTDLKIAQAGLGLDSSDGWDGEGDSGTLFHPGRGGLQTYVAPSGLRVDIGHEPLSHRLQGISTPTFSQTTTYNSPGTSGEFVWNDHLNYGAEEIDWSYFYDGAGRLATALNTKDSSLASYIYEDDGSLLTMIGDGPTFEAAGLKGTLTCPRGIGYKPTCMKNGDVLTTTADYDATGRLIRWLPRGLDLSYDARGRLYQASNADLTARYYYDASGWRVLKWVKNANGTGEIVRFVYNGTELVAERELRFADNDFEQAYEREERRYVWLGGRPVAMMRRTDAFEDDEWTDGEWEVFDIITSRIGAPVQMLNAAHEVVWSIKYTPYGTTYDEQNGSGVSCALRFPGQYHDEETGFNYNGQRYYIPEIARYNRPEPIGQAGSLDLYMYAGGNPVNAIDPTGLISWWKVAGDALGFAIGILKPFAEFDEALIGAVKFQVKLITDPIGALCDMIDTTAAMINPDTYVAMAESLLGFGEAVLNGDPEAIGRLTGEVLLFFSFAKAAKAQKVASEAAKAAKAAEAAKTAEVASRVPRKPPIVIGENMGGRVDPFARSTGATTITDWLHGRIWDKSLNTQFIDAMKAEGREIIDIGPDFERRLARRINPRAGQPPSPIYGGERKSLRGFSSYHRAFKRTGKYASEGVPSLTPPD